MDTARLIINVSDLKEQMSSQGVFNTGMQGVFAGGENQVSSIEGQANVELISSVTDLLIDKLLVDEVAQMIETHSKVTYEMENLSSITSTSEILSIATVLQEASMGTTGIVGTFLYGMGLGCFMIAMVIQLLVDASKRLLTKHKEEDNPKVVSIENIVKKKDVNISPHNKAVVIEFNKLHNDRHPKKLPYLHNMHGTKLCQIIKNRRKKVVPIGCNSSLYAKERLRLLLKTKGSDLHIETRANLNIRSPAMY